MLVRKSGQGEQQGSVAWVLETKAEMTSLEQLVSCREQAPLGPQDSGPETL